MEQRSTKSPNRHEAQRKLHQYSTKLSELFRDFSRSLWPSADANIRDQQLEGYI